MCALSCELVSYPDSVQETWLPSRCLAMDYGSDSDIPAFSSTPHYVIIVYIKLY
jgi:hypothetical protein